jgi:hypothetical protein
MDLRAGVTLNTVFGEFASSSNDTHPLIHPSPSDGQPDGAGSSAWMDRDPSAAQAARSVATRWSMPLYPCPPTGQKPTGTVWAGREPIEDRTGQDTLASTHVTRSSQSLAVMDWDSHRYVE